MKTITKKIAKNGATLYYIDGKRASRADAMYWQRQNENERKYIARIEAEKAFSDAMSEVNTTAEAIDAAVDAEIELHSNGEVSEETADNKPVWEAPHKYETVGDLEHARYLYDEFNTESNAVEISEEIADDAVVETTNDTGIDTDETAAADTTRPLVDAYYFDGGRWDLVPLEQEIVNHETLLFDKDDLLIIKGHHGAKIMFLPNGEIAFYLQPFDPDTHRYIDDFDRVAEDEFWLEMTERGLCTLDPVNNELIVADYELTDKYNEFGADTRRFKIGDEIITFYKGRWVEIYSPKFRATIDRSIYLNNIRYHTEQWICPKGQRGHIQLDEYNIPSAKFFWRMYERGFMQRANPFKITIEHVDAPATNYEVSEMEISYMRNGDNYDVFIDGDKKIVLATLETNQMQAFVDKIHGAFASDAGIKIHTDHTIEFIADEEIYIFDACNEINRHAPEGWAITFDTQGKFFPVKFNGRQVATLDSLATQKFLSPEKFFDQFKPLVTEDFSPKQQFLADRYNELAMLEQMREEIANDSEQLQTLKEMINQVKRDIAAEELAS